MPSTLSAPTYPLFSILPARDRTVSFPHLGVCLVLVGCWKLLPEITRKTPDDVRLVKFNEEWCVRGVAGSAEITRGSVTNDRNGDNLSSLCRNLRRALNFVRGMLDERKRARKGRQDAPWLFKREESSRRATSSWFPFAARIAIVFQCKISSTCYVRCTDDGLSWNAALRHATRSWNIVESQRAMSLLRNNDVSTYAIHPRTINSNQYGKPDRKTFVRLFLSVQQCARA